MSTHPRLLRRLRLGALLLLIASFNLAPLRADRGPQTSPMTQPAKAPTAVASTSAKSCPACAALQKQAADAGKSEWPNGRGPRVSADRTASTLRHTCTEAGYVMHPSWPNGRGPLVATPFRAGGLSSLAANNQN